MRLVCCLGLFLMLSLAARATRPQHAIFEGYSDLAAGKCRSVSLTEDGVLASAPTVGNLAGLDVAEAWSVLAPSDGSLLVGTAPEGRLLRVSPDGTVKQLAKFDESHLYAMALGPRGETYVGTSPDGKIYQVSSAGKVEVYFEPKEKYIWALAVAPDGSLYAGTGTKGKIYRITGKGQGESWYDSNETHIRALALEKGGSLLAGSSNSGYLYRITGKDKAVVLAGTGREEVNQIRVAPDGTIYFTATGPGKPASGGPPDSGDNPGDNKGPTLQLRDLLVTDGQHGGSDKDSILPKAGGGSSTLYRLDSSLFPEALWDTKETILSMVWSARDQAVLVGTGNDGYVYAVTPHGDATRLCKAESDSVTAMVMAGDDAILATSNPGRLFRFGQGKSQPGVYESDVVDSEGFARWGSVTIGASDPGAVKILTRSGNTAKPDKSWYPWEEANGGASQSAPARYEQVQLQIGAGIVDKIDAVYLPRNLPPHIDVVRVLPVGTGYTPLQAPVPAPAPRSADQLASVPDRDGEYKPQTRWQPSSAHGLRTVTWKASDPNNDDLIYTVSWRKRGGPDWHVLARDLKYLVLSWDTSGWADGRYELKVEASDAGDNAPGEGLTDVAISRELVVDNAPPVIRIVAQRSDAVEFTVADALSGLDSVTTSTNGKDYKALPPVDGILDAGTKRFVAKITPGQTLFIRAEDGSGNVAGAQVGN